MAHPILFQVNTRCWLRELSKCAGKRITLANVPDKIIAGWREIGFTHVWLMGVWSTGPRARQQAIRSESLRARYDRALPGWTEDDVAGSPYAISAYAVPREIGGDSGLKKIRQALHRHGLKLLLDFVPNHVGIDHPWVNQQPDLFVQSDSADGGSFIGGSAGSPLRLCHGRDPFFDPWVDTAQLDYRRSDTRSLMQLELMQLADRCDGVRCDMAMLVMNEVFQETWQANPCRTQPASGEFWVDAIAAVREAHPHFLFLAEAYWNREPDLLAQGFDFAYQKTIADAIFDQRDSVQKVVADGESWLAHGAHFLENHDERRVASRLDPDAHRAAVFAILCLPGMRFIHEGQTAGWRIQTPVQLARRQLETTDRQIEQLYQLLFSTLAKTSIGRGQFVLLEPRAAWEGNATSLWMLVLQWQSSADIFHLAIVNFAPHRSQCFVSPAIENVAAHDWTMRDLLGDEIYERGGEELQARGLYLDVPAFATQLFHFSHRQK